MLCHLSVVFGSILVPALILAWKRDESAFIAYHARQALTFQISTLLITMVLMCLSAGLGVFVLVIPLIYGVIQAIKVNNGEWVGYPVIGQWWRPELAVSMDAPGSSEDPQA